MIKNSTVYFAFFALLFSTVTIAQPAMQEPSETAYISNRTVNLLDDPNDYTGSPYYNENFLKGNIVYKGKTIAANQLMRYNASKEEFEIRDPGNLQGNIVKTIQRNTNISIEIGDETFEYISSQKSRLRGYFIPLIKGDNYSLYKKITKEYIASQKAANSMASNIAAMYKEKEILYLQGNDGTYTELPASKKGNLDAFGDMKKKVKDYAKQNKLNVKKEKDLIKVIKYTNSL